MTDVLLPQRCRTTGIVLLVALLIAVLVLHLVVPLLTAMIVYTSGCRVTHWLERKVPRSHAALWSMVIVLVIVIATGSEIFERAFQATEAGKGYGGLLTMGATSLEELRSRLPPWLAQHLPQSFDSLRLGAASWMREHATEVQGWGGRVVRTIAHLVIGLVIGALAIVQSGHRGDEPSTPWLAALYDRFRLFDNAFGAVVFAQVRIAAINAGLTAVYLLVILPALGTRLPLSFTLIAVAFASSLVPVVGNLVSNAAIVLVSLAQGIGTAALSLGFLVAVHKFEYFLNARIIGGQIHTKAYELLAAMVLFEAAFGLGGLVMAPIIYAYGKSELKAAGLV